MSDQNMQPPITMTPGTVLVSTVESANTTVETLPGDIDLRERMLELIAAGTAGEKIVRGFLIGVAIGLVLGGVCCCWVPCFGRAERERRRREREHRIRGGADHDHHHPGGDEGMPRVPWLRRTR